MSETERVYVTTSHDGPQYTTVHASRESLLSRYAEYLEDTPEARPNVEEALAAAERGEIGDLGDGDRVQVLPVQT